MWPPISRTAVLRLKSCYSYAYSTRYFHSRGAVGGNVASTGLYGFEQLKTAKGFQRFVDDAIERSAELVNSIAKMSSSAEVIRAMDEISNTVCTVVDSAELCRQTHPDREYVEEANKASMRINEYLHVSISTPIIHCMMPLRKQNKIVICFLRKLIELPVTCALILKRVAFIFALNLDRVNQLNGDIFNLSREFSQNIILDPGHVDIFPASRIPKQLHYLLSPIDEATSRTSNQSSKSLDSRKKKGFWINTSPGILHSILQFTPDDEVRKMAYIKGNSVPHANHEVLDKLIAARHELSQIMGYSSYSDFVVTPNMASSPDVVMAFLLEMSNTIKPMADEEFKSIQDFKRKKCGQRGIDLEPWDEAYYTAIMKSSAYDLDSSVVASYFPLQQCIEGLKVLVESLFGATFRSVPMAPGEAWHPDVLKMLLQHPEEGDMGYLYLDLHSRASKYPGCANFAIKGGCRISESEYQLPVVALVCNFAGSRNSSTIKLNLSEVETLFHEFGHALHALLSRTDYQHFSGTRVVLDFAEVPSNLFEYYAWDYRVLRRFAKHYSTGEVIPEKLVESLQGARDMFAATELQRQIYYASVDQTLFGERLDPRRDTSSIVADMKRQYTSWKHVEGSHWHIRFSHLLGYGAGYYSYLYAKCFAATIWQKLCQEDPLSLTTGTALRTKLLQHGGSKDPADMLHDLVGDGIIRRSGTGIVPDITSVLNELKLNEDKAEAISTK